MRPINLTEKEDWIWLRLTDYELFDQNDQKGRKRWADVNGTELVIKTTVTEDMDKIMEMIKELAIYEDMLDQCAMTKEFLNIDYKNGPKPIGDVTGPTYISTVAWMGDEPIGYTVSIGKPI